jgi:hypothetical protein
MDGKPSDFLSRSPGAGWPRMGTGTRLTRSRLFHALVLTALGLAVALTCARKTSPPSERARVVVTTPGETEASAPEPQLGRAMIPVSATTAVKIVPHPITAERRVLDRQRTLFASVESALASGDVPRARALLQEHRATYDDRDAWLDFREGYEVLAECQERPGPDAAARGARFVAEHAGSTLRRRVRRVCLGPKEQP